MYLTLKGQIPRLYLEGVTRGIVAVGCSILRIQDESSDNKTSYINCYNSSIAVSESTLNSEMGRMVWYNDSLTQKYVYPYCKEGDRYLKVTPSASSSYGWECVSGSSVGSLTRVTGTGPSPELLDDYFHPNAQDYQIEITTGGVTGTAVYKVQSREQGTGSYVDFETGATTTELAHAVKDGAPSFQIKWPTGVTYVSGDKWAITGVTLATWKEIEQLGA